MESEPGTGNGETRTVIAVDAAVLAQSGIVGLMTTRDRIILSVNRAICEATGYTAGELVGQSTRILYPDDASHEEAGRRAYAALSRDRVYRGEQTFRRKDGTTAWVELSISLLPDSTNTCVLVAVDSSARQQALAQLSLQDDILAAIGDGVTVVGGNRRILYANRAIEQMLGYASGELLGMDVRLLHADDGNAETVARDIEGALGAAGEWSGYFHQARKDGSTVWTDLRITLSEHPAWGKVRIGVMRDVGNRKLLQEALARSEARYRTVVEDQTEVISRVRPDGTFVFVNDVYCRVFGKSTDELIGQRWHPVAHPDDLAEIEARLREMSPDNPVVVIDNRVFLPDGAVRWMQFVNRGLFDADGSLREIQSVGRDITRVRETEAALRESEQRLEMALEGSGMVAWDWDVPADEMVVDSRVEDMLGHAPQRLRTIGSWLALLDPRDRAGVEHAIDAALRGDSEALEIEGRLRHADGHWLTVEARARVLRRDADAAPLRMAGILLDVTQRKRLNEEGLQMLRRVEALIREAAPTPPGAAQRGPANPDQPRTPGPVPDRRRPDLGADRRAPAGGHQHRDLAPPEHDGQAGAARHRGGHPVCSRQRPDREVTASLCPKPICSYQPRDPYWGLPNALTPVILDRIPQVFDQAMAGKKIPPVHPGCPLKTYLVDLSREGRGRDASLAAALLTELSYFDRNQAEIDLDTIESVMLLALEDGCQDLVRDMVKTCGCAFSRTAPCALGDWLHAGEPRTGPA